MTLERLELSGATVPDGNGADLMKELHVRLGISGVAVTGYGMDADIAHAREMGFALHCQGWEVGRLNGMEMVVIRFRLSGSAGLSFSLPAGQIPYLLQALGGVVAAGEPHASNVTLQ